MEPDALAAVSTAGAMTLVAVMAMDAWSAAGDGMARLFGSSGSGLRSCVEANPDRHARQIASADGVRCRLASSWGECVGLALDHLASRVTWAACRFDVRGEL
jgi:hypothetical protein